MPTKIIDKTTRWPRFSAYVIQGTRVVPAPGAKIEWYDPWAAYREAAASNRESPPYLSLVEVANRIRLEIKELRSRPILGWIVELAHSDSLSELPEAVTDLLVEYSAKHGQLGIFHQEIIYLEWGKFNWSWVGGEWKRTRSFRYRGPKDELHAVLGGDQNDRLELRPYLSTFLGSEIPEEFPGPESEVFWNLYGESVWRWLYTALSFGDAVLEADFDTLNQLAHRAVRLRRADGSRIRTVMAFPSLLSSFAEMYFQDQELGKLVGLCDLCGDAFTSDRNWTKYCGPKCATKARQKRFKDRKPDYYSKSRS